MATPDCYYMRYASLPVPPSVSVYSTDTVILAEMSKQGEFQPLKFPAFRRELLYQNHWSPGDDLGRIKIVISEGFPRDSPSVPFERVKNILAFSFQHAPLGEPTVRHHQ